MSIKGPLCNLLNYMDRVRSSLLIFLGGISGESNYDAPRANGMCHGKILWLLRARNGQRETFVKIILRLEKAETKFNSNSTQPKGQPRMKCEPPPPPVTLFN